MTKILAAVFAAATLAGVAVMIPGLTPQVEAHNYAIKKGDPARNGAVDHPDRIIKMQVAADAEKKS